MGKIYTKKGDKGQTKTIGRVMSKDDDLAEALGTVDELNSWLGYCRERFPISQLKNIQTNLMKINAILAGADKPELEISNYEIRKLEKWIDKMTDDLPLLTNFVYPVGEIQVARAVCRRAERVVVKFANNTPLKYLNRLSDYLFTLARWVNMKSGVDEEVWKLVQ